MNLSSIITGVPEYIEFAWRCAPNAAAQSLTSDTETTLTIDTEVADTGDLVSAPSSNQFTLPAGTYYFEAACPLYAPNGTSVVLILATAAGARITSAITQASADITTAMATLNGQFKLASQTAMVLRVLANIYSTDVVEVSGRWSRTFASPAAQNFGVATPLIQRTTIKLWKLK